MKKTTNLEIKHLPQALKTTVRVATALLGEVIQEYEGRPFYRSIESYRQALKNLRLEQDEASLFAIFKKLKKHNKAEQFKIAHSFALLLELMNCCESAYRTWRLRHSKISSVSSSEIDLDFVLTAHPTEARTKEVVQLLRKLTMLLVNGLQNDLHFKEAEIRSVLRMLWNFSLAKTEQPTVINEAEYIYTIIFSGPVLDFILTEQQGYRLRLSTWVGGDKDGHPGVDDKTMVACLEGSRRHLITIISAKLNDVLLDLKHLRAAGQKRDKEIKQINMLARELNVIKKIKIHDTDRVEKWKLKYKSFVGASKRLINRHHQVMMIDRLLVLFPALVLPIELREDANKIAEATSKPSMPICKMLKVLSKLAKASDITAYAHALIISNCSSAADIDNANSIIQMAANTKSLPIVPLFEDKESLLGAPDILQQWFKKRKNKEQVKKHWNNRFEVMLGYSDSSKQVGVLSSRCLIRQAMFALEGLLKKVGVKPVFFHGAGGSVDRGGGSLGEQIAWWPNSAIKMPTLTVQGEMVQRTFATQEILNSQCRLLSREAAERSTKEVSYQVNPALDKYVHMVEHEYQKFIADYDLLNKTLDATPFHYLNLLKIGSRPVKRSSGEFNLKNLRAIPWVLCWTQTRVLLPTWWGTGIAWLQLSHREKHALKILYKTDPFFSSFVKALGFTLAKVEMSIWGKYLTENLAKKDATFIFHYFEHELHYAKRFIHDVTGSRDLVSHRLWLQESIQLRSPYIHILNLLQIISMQQEDEKLMKETLVGIACGMLTTG